MGNFLESRMSHYLGGVALSLGKDSQSRRHLQDMRIFKPFRKTHRGGSRNKELATAEPFRPEAGLLPISLAICWTTCIQCTPPGSTHNDQAPKPEAAVNSQYLPDGNPSRHAIQKGTDELAPAKQPIFIGRAMAGFANRFYAQASARSNPEGNFVVSPLAVYQALAIARAAASGWTERQINHLMGLPEPSAKVDVNDISKVTYQTTDSADEIWSKLTTGSTLDLAIPLFMSKGYPLAPRFLDKSDWNSGRRIHPIDFRHRPKRARKKINRWIEKNTSGKLPAVIHDEEIAPSTRALMVSAIWYNVTWPHLFDEKLTANRPFQLHKGQMKMVSTMQVLAKFRLLNASKRGYRAINLPFQQKTLSITFILPNPDTSIRSIESSLDFDEIAKSVDQSPILATTLTLPRFEIHPTKALSLREILGEMGMKDAFDSKKADFFRLTASEKPIALQDLIHKARIIVDENADLGVVAPKSDFAQGQPFTLDRPFLFFVHHKVNRTILFAGRVMNPQAPVRPRRAGERTGARRAKRARRRKVSK